VVTVVIWTQIPDESRLSRMTMPGEFSRRNNASPAYAIRKKV
jgi:hypothetical protein